MTTTSCYKTVLTALCGVALLCTAAFADDPVSAPLPGGVRPAVSAPLVLWKGVTGTDAAKAECQKIAQVAVVRFAPAVTIKSPDGTTTTVVGDFGTRKGGVLQATCYDKASAYATNAKRGAIQLNLDRAALAVRLPSDALTRIFALDLAPAKPGESAEMHHFTGTDGKGTTLTVDMLASIDSGNGR